MSVHIKLNQFEGPLDLLLYLIDKAQLSIRDVFVSEITEQYLSAISQMDLEGLDNASEFAALAATLIEIKSRRLLPRAEDESLLDEQDPEELLIMQLEEYRRVKYETALLRSLEDMSRLCMHRPQDEQLYGEGRVELENLSLDGLKDALAQVLARRERTGVQEQAGSIERETYTVRQRIFQLQSKLLRKRNMTFFELFEGDVTKIEVIVTFCALLELMRLERVDIIQDTQFGEIRIIATGGGKKNDAWTG